jgi:transposase
MLGLDPERLVFLDETGCTVNMTRQHGWALRGESVCQRVPGSRGRNISVVGAIRSDRVLCYDVMPGSLNKEKWQAFVREKLAPALYPGDVLVLDNLRVHKDPVALQWLNDAGVLVLFQPPYSPDLNPIELCWAFIKRHLRKIGEGNPSKMKRAIRRALERVTSRHLEAWFAHCCYPQSN